MIDMTPPKHILGTFDEALASLRNNVLMMAGLTERTFDRAIRGLMDRDNDLCANAIAGANPTMAHKTRSTRRMIASFYSL